MGTESLRNLVLPLMLVACERSAPPPLPGAPSQPSPVTASRGQDTPLPKQKGIYVRDASGLHQLVDVTDANTGFRTFDGPSFPNVSEVLAYGDFLMSCADRKWALYQVVAAGQLPASGLPTLSAERGTQLRSASTGIIPLPEGTGDFDTNKVGPAWMVNEKTEWKPCRLRLADGARLPPGHYIVWNGIPDGKLTPHVFPFSTE